MYTYCIAKRKKNFSEFHTRIHLFKISSLVMRSFGGKFYIQYIEAASKLSAKNIHQLVQHLKTFLRSVPQLLTVAYTDTEENWIQNQFQLLQDQYTSVVPDKQYFDDLINLLLWNIPVSENFIATWFKMIIERARRVLKIHPGKDCLCLFLKIIQAMACIAQRLPI